MGTYGIMVVHEGGNTASVFRDGISNEHQAKMQRGRAANKYAHEDFFVYASEKIAAMVADVNDGHLTVVDGQLTNTKPKPKPKAKQLPKPKQEIPANILHMINHAETPEARLSWERVAYRAYA